MASLPEASGYRAMWLETTKSAHHHGGAGWEFGTCLWSPSLNKSGARYYNVMKEPRRGDLVLHNYHYVPDQASPAAHYLCATSIVLRPAKITTSEPPSAGDWTGRKEYFRIELEGFQWLDTRLSIAMFVEYYEEQLRNELLLHYSRFFPFTINANQVRLGQGMYLARVTPALFALFTDALGIEKAQTPVVPDTTDAHRQYAEGERQRREQFAFLRNPALARDAKERDTYTCVVCHFSPAQSYGAAHRAVSLECHHLTPLAERNDPALKHSTLADVVTVCANCHRLLHSRKEALSLAEARRFLAQRV